MQYVKIKRGSEAYDLMYNIFNFHKVWGDKKDEIEEFLGFPMNNKIAFVNTSLWVDPQAIEKHRPEWDKDFKKSSGIREAKSKSKVRTAWVSLCERLGLETYKVRDFSWKYGLHFTGNMQFHSVGDEYFITHDNEKYSFHSHEWAELVKESEYMRLKAEDAEKREKESA